MNPVKEKKYEGFKMPDPPDLRERGAASNDEPQMSNRRLFCQLQVFDNCKETGPLIEAFKSSSLEGVLYLDANHPNRVGLLVMTEDCQVLVGAWRELLQSQSFQSLKIIPEMTMTGRTYSFGREKNLEDWLIEKPKRNALNSQWPWAIWYPLRRKPEFALLSGQDQGRILHEHATLGMSYGAGGYAADIRLACYGLDTHDNEFVLGIVGAELYPLSRLIQDMRKTEQTSKYIQSLGPFFIGRVIWQSTLSS